MGCKCDMLTGKVQVRATLLLTAQPAICVQVIARIHDPQGVVRRLIHNLLICVGRHHPQALMYPLLVACKSQSGQRRSAAMSVVDNVRQHSATLVEQAQLVRPQQPPIAGS